MRRDPTEFRNRVLRWKNGELVYENGRVIPSYEDGKDRRYYPTTGGAGVVSIPNINQNVSTEILLYDNSARNILGFTPYLGTIMDWEEVADGNVGKITPAFIGTVADVFLPGLGRGIKYVKQLKQLQKITPRISDKIKYQKQIIKQIKLNTGNGAILGVGLYGDVGDYYGIFNRNITE